MLYDNISNYKIDGQSLTLKTLMNLVYSPSVHYEIKDEAKESIKKSRLYIENKIAAGETMYGVNTGFGVFSNVRISDKQIEELQVNLIRSHSVGVGEILPQEVVKAILILRANTLARGQSGVRIEVVQKILDFLNSKIYPVIPSQGSLGASGDLAPLSHLALSLIGEGEVFYNGSRLPTSEVLKKLKIDPLVLKAKEGLSLINGCQVMNAIGLMGLYRAQNLLKYADIAAAMTLEATRGSRKAYSTILASTRPHAGEARTISNLNKILGETSTIAESHLGCHKVQDAYSIRCVPAVHGAVKDVVASSIHTCEIEANSSTDNPLVFADEDEVLSCGNFHGEPVALAMDFCAIAMANLGNISERRLAKLIDPPFSELPAFLTSHGGLQSGYMIVQYTAASLVSENKIHAHPASVDSIPTSLGKEDHVSMGTIAARKFVKVIENVENIIAMELLAAAQGLDFLKPLVPTAGVLKAYQVIRKHVSFANNDRVFSEDIKKMRELLESGELLREVESSVQQLLV